jgi:hypothetical protein
VEKNIGYKGIGRLSGYSYCDRVTFASFTDIDQYLTLNIREINTQVQNLETFNLARYIERNEVDLIRQNKPVEGFCVLLENINFSLKEVLQAGFMRELSIRVKCKYNVSDSLTETSDILAFIEESNNSTNYDLFFNNNAIERVYSTDPKIEKDYLVNVYLNEEDKSVIAKVIYKLGKQVNVSYRKHLDNGIKVYNKGMLIATDIDVVDKTLSYTGEYDKKPSDFLSGLKSIYAEIHIVSPHILPNSARTWFSYLVPKKYDPKHIQTIMIYLNELMNKSHNARYKYSYFAREKSKTREKLKQNFLDSISFFVKDYDSKQTELDYWYIDPNEKKEKNKSRKQSIQDNKNYILPKESGYKSENAKLNDIIEELSLLNVNNFKNAAAILFRTFLELSLKYTAIRSDFEIKNDYINLYEVLKHYNDYLHSKNLKRMSKNKADSRREEIRIILDDKEALRIFNNYVHDLDSNTKVIVLLLIRDGLLPILDDIYDVQNT